jgi:import inner membrane translocase subunit TIM23
MFQSSAVRLNAAQKELNWNEFLALRVRRRRVNVISSCFTAFGGVLVGWGFVSNVEIDPTEMIMGFDPLMVYGLGVFLCGGLGYLVGPSVGDIVFKRILIRKQAASFAKKNTEFLQHIKKNRPDPRNQSYSNPVTDYYGEKIGSLKDYRQWLRDGRAYRKKAEKFL